MVIDEFDRDRRQPRPWWFLAGVGGIVLGGLIGLVIPERLLNSSPVRTFPSDAFVTFAPPNDLVFNLGPAQARYVAVTMAFFDAYGQGRADAIKAMVTDDVVGGDCDPSTDRNRAFRGRPEFERWLALRIAEGDRFVVQRIFNENPDASSGGQVVGVTYAMRDSEAIRRRHMGIRDLVYRPTDVAKIVFTGEGMHLVALNLGGCGHP